MSWKTVAPAAHGDAQILRACELDRPRDIRGIRAACDQCRPAIEGAVPLQHNGYKLPLMKNLVKRAIRGVEGSWTS